MRNFDIGKRLLMQLQVRQRSFYKWDFQGVKDQGAGRIWHRKEPWTFISKEMSLAQKLRYHSEKEE